MTAPEVVGPVPEASLGTVAAAPGSLLSAIAEDPDALVYFLLNVGDGDTQLLLLPPDSNDHVRRLVIVDVATPGKLPALLDALHAAGLIQTPGTAGQIRLLVATHPHFDHIGGLSDLLKRYNGPSGCIDQFWEPGYIFTTPSFHNLMVALESSPWIRRLQPTAGTRLTLDWVRFTVLGPGIGLRNRFDTYGVGINDSSITIMVDYPASHLYAQPSEGSRKNRRAAPQPGRRLLLGADAQFTSWAQTTVDFPALQQSNNRELARELRAARGKDYLTADLFKLSHHASKHGINLELLERVSAPIALVSSVAGGGKYGFPHALAMDSAREARQATTTKGLARDSDQQLGIHVTGSYLDSGAPAGSIAAVISRVSGRPIRLFRMGDEPRSPVDLTAAREVLSVKSGGAKPNGAKPGGATSGGAKPAGAKPGGARSGGAKSGGS
ncbi:ComEC/Rec2 family competence protein [Jatrophihabitans sp.]|jgi:beta-lactamase superfamily II metal-dependent hydrolase|uniref:ComEC/Rec2 family competence protein n=1 Tax=Jatrophihabitans sp. TaxID=1932789 RepID=UPI002EF22BCD